MEVISIPDPAGGAPIQVEVESVPEAGGGVYREAREGGASRVIRASQDVFGEGLELARACARRVAGKLDEINRESRPEEVTVQLSIKLDSQVGAVVARASAGAQLQVTIKWKCGAPDAGGRTGAGLEDQAAGRA
jgi:hypothetical protein